MGAYETLEYKGQYHTSTLRYLIEIKSDSITFKYFDWPSQLQKDTIEKHNFIIVKNYLIINSEYGPDTFQIDHVNKDSIVFEVGESDKYKNKLIFKKLVTPPKLQYLDLSNKAYAIVCDNGYTDSIDFINDSILLHIRNDRFIHIVDKWFINEYKGFKFLIIGDIENLPQLITSSNNDLIELIIFRPNELNVEMNLLTSEIELKQLYGSWHEISRKNLDSIEYKWSKPLPDNVDWRINLNITKDSIEILELNRKRKLKWIPNTTNQYIYFPDDFDTENSTWKITLLEKDRLKIERYNKEHYNFSDPFEIIEFKKRR